MIELPISEAIKLLILNWKVRKTESVETYISAFFTITVVFLKRHAGADEGNKQTDIK